MKIRFVGDVCLSGDFENVLKQQNNSNFFFPLKEDNISLLIGNLESPISDKGVPSDGKFACFRVSPDIVGRLTSFDVLSLSNNHISDYGNDAAFQTKHLVESIKVKTVGFGSNLHEAQQLSISVIDNVKIGVGVFSCLTTNGFNIASQHTPGVSTFSLAHLKKAIQFWKSEVDVLFIYFHWGLENTHDIVEDQIITAQTCIDVGADAVIGTHGHVIQPYQKYKGKPVFYGLGNLVFSDFDYQYKGKDGSNKKGRYIQKENNLESLSPVFEINQSSNGTFSVAVKKVDAFKFKNNTLYNVPFDQLTVKISILNKAIDSYSSSFLFRKKKGHRTEIDYISSYKEPNVVYFYNSPIVRKKLIIKNILFLIKLYLKKILRKIL